jgi:hypothetical protein
MAEQARSLTETPEFQKAVADAVAKAVPDIVAKLAAARGGTPGTDDRAFAEGLAVAIAQLSNQGVGRMQITPPDVIERRKVARTKMTELLIAAKAENRIPTYKLRNTVYLDEIKVDPIYVDPASKKQMPTEIDWPGVPNEAMVPANETALAIHAAFCESIGTLPKEHLIPDRAMSVTANGLVVRAGSLAMRPASVLGDDRTGAAAPFGEGLRVKGRGGPGEHKEIRVLGTTAPPARVGF